MYYAHFGLKQPPFKITPNTEVFFTGGNRGAVLDALIYAILSGEGIVKVVGEVGSGKTMLCRMLQTQLPSKIESIFLANPSVAPEDVLHAIAFELQLKLPKNADRLKVMQVLQSHLLARHAAGKQVVIFVEEAQGMPLATLEEIRLLSNLETKHDKLLQIVLFGQPELDENLNQTNIRQLRERITHSFNLTPLKPQEIGEYLIFRLRAAGYFGPHLFTQAAINKIAASAQGLVRRVNILADKSLLSAFAANEYQVTPKHVKAAILDSEFGAEQAKNQAKQTKNWLWAALLLGALGLGFAASLWPFGDKQAATNISSSVSVNPAESPQSVANNLPTQVVTAPNIPASKPVMPQAEVSINHTPASGQLKQNGTQTDLLASRLAATSAWLASQPPSTVSIQLMGAKSDQQMRIELENLSQRIDQDNIFVYRTKVNNAPFLSVLYGTFASRETAMQALQKLPADIQKNHPQLRTVAGVLQETK
jgi:MSHA biogenesis protein MshM